MSSTPMSLSFSSSSFCFSVVVAGVLSPGHCARERNVIHSSPSSSYRSSASATEKDTFRRNYGKRRRVSH
ncbi:hypothetical protein F2P81_002038 [Scophthalmus maximus]|uniref:Uncharacterized protein n=1 Tax=Scophthalmus maximus TaxID=52904 RepID=A0A6A4TL14_SCOMX|nr:hypothetical protein F2P81_002038 [Scophthalmus maximus]